MRLAGQLETMSTMDELKRGNKWMTGGSCVLVILIFSSISTFSVNQYQYGISDHSIVIPFLKASVDSDLFLDDYLLVQKSYYYTFFWDSLSVLVKFLHVDMRTLFFAVYFISIYATFLAVYLIATTLFKRREVGFLSLFFLLFAKSALGGASTLESILYTRAAVLPILLFSIYLFLKKRYLLSFLLQGVGFLVHPLTAAYAIAMLFISSILNLKQMGIRKFLLCVSLLLVSASPILIWKMLHSPESLSFLYADPRWVELLRLRSSHHIFPFSWSRSPFLRAVLLLCTFFLSWKHRPEPGHHRVVLSFTATILGLCTVGTIFSELLPLSVVLNLQFLRSFQFIMYFAIVYFANYFFARMELRKNVYDRLVVGLMSICILYAAVDWKYAYVGFLGMAVFMILYHLVSKRHLLPNRFVLVLLTVVLILGIIVYPRRGSFSTDNAQESDWLLVQEWAKKNTDLNDLFVVPPNIEGFRVESERPIYGDWKDGTLMNFSPAFGREWYRRMENLGYKKGGSLEEDFKNLSEAEFINIANEMRGYDRKAFLVMFSERDTLDFPIAYGNDRFVVYEIVLKD